MFDPSKPPLIEETLLKSRRSLDELAHRRSVTVMQNIKVNTINAIIIMHYVSITHLIVITLQRKRVIRGEDIKVKRPEAFVREFRIKEGSQRKVDRRQREVSRRRFAKIPSGSMKDTVGLVVRIHEGRNSSKAIKNKLRELGLNDKYDAVFMKLDDDNISE
jgi:hypothetical protein